MLILERPAGPRDLGEMSAAIVEIKHVGFPRLDEPRRPDHQSAGVLRMQFGAAPNPPRLDVAVVTNVLGTIPRDVEIQGAVVVDVRQSQRRAARAPSQTRLGSRIPELPTFVQVAENPVRQGRNQEVGSTIPVQIHEDRPATDLAGDPQPDRFGDVGEPPLAEIPKQRRVPRQAAEQNIRLPVPVKVTDCHPAAVLQDAVGCRGEVIEGIGEHRAHELGGHLAEPDSRPTCGPLDRERAPANPWLLMPGKSSAGLGVRAGRIQARQDKEAGRQPDLHPSGPQALRGWAPSATTGGATHGRGRGTGTLRRGMPHGGDRTILGHGQKKAGPEGPAVDQSPFFRLLQADEAASEGAIVDPDYCETR